MDQFDDLLLLSENLVFSCFPRTLRELNFDISYSSHAQERYDNIFQVLLDLRLNRPMDWFKRFLMMRLPMIGIFIKPVNTPTLPMFALKEYRRARFEAAPPSVSYWEPATQSMSNPLRLLANPTYDMPLYQVRKVPASEETYRYRIAFHLFNICLWITLGSRFPIQRNLHPIAWAFKWNNIIGSALYLPVLVYRLRYAPPAPFLPNASLLSRIWRFTLTTMLPWSVTSFTVGAAGLTALGITSSTWSPLARVFALGVAILGEFVLHLPGHSIW